MAHPSSHQKEAIYQRYPSLKMVLAIATLWNVHAMTGKYEPRPISRLGLVTKTGNPKHYSLFRVRDQGGRFTGMVYQVSWLYVHIADEWEAA